LHKLLFSDTLGIKRVVVNKEELKMSEIFDKKGMMIIPEAEQQSTIAPKDRIIASDLYCPNGHNLISSRAKFGKDKGVVLKVRQGECEGTIAISTICNSSSSITVDIDLVEGEPAELYCPECNEQLPIHSKCSCGGDFVALFSTPECNFSESLGICNIVGCSNAHIIENGELTKISRSEIL